MRSIFQKICSIFNSKDWPSFLKSLRLDMNAQSVIFDCDSAAIKSWISPSCFLSLTKSCIYHVLKNWGTVMISLFHRLSFNSTLILRQFTLFRFFKIPFWDAKIRLSIRYIIERVYCAFQHFLNIPFGLFPSQKRLGGNSDIPTKEPICSCSELGEIVTQPNFTISSYSSSGINLGTVYGV